MSNIPNNNISNSYDIISNNYPNIMMFNNNNNNNMEMRLPQMHNPNINN